MRLKGPSALATGFLWHGIPEALAVGKEEIGGELPERGRCKSRLPTTNLQLSASTGARTESGVDKDDGQ